MTRRKYAPYTLYGNGRLWWCPHCKMRHRVHSYWPIRAVGFCPKQTPGFVLKMVEERSNDT